MTSNINEAGWNFEHSYSRLPDMFYSKENPYPPSSPKMIIFNDELCAQLGLNPEELHGDKGADVFSGKKLPDHSFPLSQAYAGHQFGHFTMLGDGRAVLIGEQITPSGARFDIQLKGSGRTRFSRRGDGNATLGPMLREYIISEAMHALGIPTTRSLAVVTTGEEVLRETYLPGAVLTRVASSHIRVGTFEYAALNEKGKELKTYADYTIKRHFPHLEAEEQKYLLFLQHVIDKQAQLISKWQLVGFIHGVMNTDNMTISGETIDYGPCAFIDVYDPETVFSSIDTTGRYAYSNQPPIGEWNLARFAETLLTLLDEDDDVAIEMAQEVLMNYRKLYNQYWFSGMSSKLGIFHKEDEDELLIHDLLNMMEKFKVDYTNTFIALTFNKFDDGKLFQSSEFKDWKVRWQTRINRQKESSDEVHKLMKNNNPAVIPRNHRVEEALEAAVGHGNYQVLENLLNVLQKPYAHSKDQEEYQKPPEPSTAPYVTYCGT